jgi:hypothetical protein
VREAVWQLLFARAPPGLVRVVGKQVYHRCAARSLKWGTSFPLAHRSACKIVVLPGKACTGWCGCRV